MLHPLKSSSCAHRIASLVPNDANGGRSAKAAVPEVASTYPFVCLTKREDKKKSHDSLASTLRYRLTLGRYRAV